MFADCRESNEILHLFLMFLECSIIGFQNLNENQLCLMEFLSGDAFTCDSFYFVFNNAPCVVGAVLGCMCRSREHVQRGAPEQHHPRRELPRVAAQEELAERALPVHQEHHGSLS